MSAKIDGRKLVLAGGKTAEFPYPVSKVKYFEGVYIVLVEPPFGERFNENAYGVNGEGEILWKVTAVKHVREDSPYTGISEKAGVALLHNWDGYTLAIEPRTGKILREQFTK